MEGAGGREARRRVEAWLVAALEGRGRPWLPTDDGARGLLLIIATESLDCRNMQVEPFGLGAGAGRREQSFMYKKAQQPKSKNIHTAGDTHTTLANS